MPGDPGGRSLPAGASPSAGDGRVGPGEAAGAADTEAAGTEAAVRQALAVREASLLRRTAELEEARDIARLGMWRLDLVADTMTWSPQMSAMFGMSPGMPVPSPADIRAMSDPGQIAAADEAVSDALATGRPWEVEIGIRGRDGVERWMVQRGVADHGPDGTLTGSHGTALEVTEEHRAADMIRKAEARLAEAQRLEAIGRLAGGVAHDFNNILMAINGSAELLAQSIPRIDPRRMDVDAIIDAVGRATGLTTQLLAFGRRQALRPTPVDLGVVLADMGPLLRRTLGEQVDLRIDLGTGIGQVRADRSQLEQVILNLALNARDAMPAGGNVSIALASFEVAAGSVPQAQAVEPGRYVRLTVADSGHGIEEAVLPLVFEPFFTTRAMGRGTGLGLATVSGIVAQSGGWIDVSSRPGAGTTFAVHLPAIEATPDQGPAPARAAGGAMGETVLVVEDEAPVRQAVTRMLRDLGYNVIDVAGAEAALGLEVETMATVDVVVADVAMPGVSGVRLATLLAERRPGLRTVLMSGYDPDPSLHDRLAQPGTAFLAKPFTRADLARTLRDVIDGPHSKAAPEA